MLVNGGNPLLIRCLISTEGLFLGSSGPAIDPGVGDSVGGSPRSRAVGNTHLFTVGDEAQGGVLRHVTPLARAGSGRQEVDQPPSQAQRPRRDAQQVRKALRQRVALCARVPVLCLQNRTPLQRSQKRT